jgi:hypothetical protein
MITLQHTVTAPHDRATVFAYLADFRHATEWDAGTVACSLISGDGGVGTAYLNRSRFLGRETELTYVVKESVPDTRYVIEGSNSTVTSLDTITLLPIAGGTRVTYRADFTFAGAARFLEPLLRFPLKKLGKDAEQTLTAALQNL